MDLFQICILRSTSGNNSSHHSISSDVQGSDAAVEEEVNGNYKFKSIGGSAGSEDCVVGCNHQDQSRGCGAREVLWLGNQKVAKQQGRQRNNSTYRGQEQRLQTQLWTE